MNRNEFERAVYDPANQLNATDVAILLWYANHIYWKNPDSMAWGAAESIARDIRMGKRTVEGRRPGLERQGWLVDTGERHYGKNGRPVVKYTLAIPDFPATPAVNLEDPEIEDEGVSRKSDDVSRKYEGGFPQDGQGFPAPGADEYVSNMSEHVNEEYGEDSTVPDGPVPEEEDPSLKKEVDNLTLLSRGLRSDFEKTLRRCTASPKQKQEAAGVLLRTRVRGSNALERCENALISVGVEFEDTEEW